MKVLFVIAISWMALGVAREYARLDKEYSLPNHLNITLDPGTCSNSKYLLSKAKDDLLRLTDATEEVQQSAVIMKEVEPLVNGLCEEAKELKLIQSQRKGKNPVFLQSRSKKLQHILDIARRDPSISKLTLLNRTILLVCQYYLTLLSYSISLKFFSM